MKLLLTNDDGYDAEGLRALEAAVSGEIHVVAPLQPMSECSHRVTTRQPLEVREISPRHWAIRGTPADCVRVGLRSLLPEAPDWVLSGINRGGNLGHDIHISGTVAAAREAAILGVRSAAISHHLVKDRTIDWAAASRRSAGVIAEIMRWDWQPREFANINLPHLLAAAADPEWILCDVCHHPLPVQFRAEQDRLIYSGEYSRRDREPGADTEVCFNGKISVSKIRV